MTAIGALPSSVFLPGDTAVLPSGTSAGLGGFFKDILSNTARDLAVFGQDALYRKIGVVKDEPAPIDPAPAPEDTSARNGVSPQTLLVVGGAALALILVVALIR